MDCVFCRIVNNELEHVKIWEDPEFIAILDINPAMKGQTVVLVKEHYDSYVFDMPDDIYLRLFLSAKKVSAILEKGLPVKRVGIVMEGMGINHAHLKLYPLHGLKDKFEQMWAKNKINFTDYEGYISTQLGDRTSLDELKQLAEQLRK